MRHLTLMTLWGASNIATASDCVTLDADRDSLSEAEQRAALVLLADAVSSAGYPTSAPCSEQWTVSHVRLGEAITVRLSTQEALEQFSVSRVEELPAAYERMVRAIQTGTSAAETADRDSVTIAEQSPRRVQADDLLYIQLGGGITGIASPAGGTAFGIGYRHSLDRFAVDLSGLNFIIPNDTSSAEHFAMTLITLSGLYYFDGSAARSLYAGGGLGYGFAVNDDGVNGGLQFNGAVGYELLRHSTIRLFPQLDVTLPVYRIDQDVWVPSTSLTLNVAFVP